MYGFQDLTGQQFERLTVIKRVENYIKPNGKIIVRWLCRCNCDGKEIIVNSGNLKSGHTKSCGCLKIEKTKEANKKYNKYDLSDEYGIGYTSNTNEPFFFNLEDYDKIKNYCWIIRTNGYIVAGSLDNDNKIIYMHRLIMNCPDDIEVDHIYHNKFDNRKEFLRFATDSQNQINQGIQLNNTSGVTGVYWSTKNERWIAQISINGKTYHLGSFDDFNKAIEARKDAEEKYFGEFTYKK